MSFQALRAVAAEEASGLFSSACHNVVVKKRLLSALLAYGVLIALACVLLKGKVLAAVLILFAGLIAKTLISMKLQSSESPDSMPDDDEIQK